MKNFGEIRHIAEAASSAGLETRDILDGSLFSESELGLLKLLKSSLKDPKQRERLLDVLESRSESPLPLAEIITVFDRFSEIQNQLGRGLTENDIKLLRFTIKYFEDWFYRGKWTIIPERPEAEEDEKPYAYFSVPAGIINLATKFKEKNELVDKIGGFDQARLVDLQNEVGRFAAGLFSNELKSSMSRAELHGARDVFKRSARSVENATGPYGNKAGDLYFLKTCLVAAEMNRRQQKVGSAHIFIPDAIIPPGKNEYIPFDFSNGQDPKNNSMHYPTHRIAYCKFVVEYLRRSAETIVRPRPDGPA